MTVERVVVRLPLPANAVVAIIEGLNRRYPGASLLTEHDEGDDHLVVDIETNNEQRLPFLNDRPMRVARAASYWGGLRGAGAKWHLAKVGQKASNLNGRFMPSTECGRPAVADEKLWVEPSAEQLDDACSNCVRTAGGWPA